MASYWASCKRRGKPINEAGPAAGERRAAAAIATWKMFAAFQAPPHTFGAASAKTFTGFYRQILAKWNPEARKKMNRT